jgi:hypothetical protein
VDGTGNAGMLIQVLTRIAKKDPDQTTHCRGKKSEAKQKQEPRDPLVFIRNPSKLIGFLKVEPSGSTNFHQFLIKTGDFFNPAHCRER